MPARGVAGWHRPAAAAFWQTVGVGAAALLLVWAMHGFAMTRVLPDGWNPPPTLRNEAGAMMKAVSSAIMVPAPVRGIVFQIEHASGGQQQFLLGQKSSRGWWLLPARLALQEHACRIAAGRAAAVPGLEGAAMGWIGRRLFSRRARRWWRRACWRRSSTSASATCW
ncbi:MAG: hypothetical protein MZV49_25185 [Rhodopseudomonas palustris]|nr:hypothetical protein [Rhodopseudomonas palustris]